MLIYILHCYCQVWSVYIVFFAKVIDVNVTGGQLKAWVFFYATLCVPDYKLLVTTNAEHLKAGSCDYDACCLVRR